MDITEDVVREEEQEVVEFEAVELEGGEIRPEQIPQPVDEGDEVTELNLRPDQAE